MADRGDRKYSHSDSKLYSPLDDPPNSRLFIISSKQLTEEDFRNAFSKFGEIEEIWVVKDRQTGDHKGVTYIKYSKTSEAANAMEAMNGKVIGDTTRHIKVMIAASRDQGSKRDGNEEEKIQRLFVIVPKSMTDDELYKTFKVYGEIDYATIIKDKDTRESKGFAYIKYYKFSHAAAAYEQCDRKFKAVFAEPRKPRQNETSERNFSNSFDLCPRSSSNLTLPEINTDGYTKLQVIGSPVLNQDQMWKLFDIIPGMDYCQLRLEGRQHSLRSVSTVVYSNPQAAAHACEKLHGFEYPPGNRLIVKPEYDSHRTYTEPIRNSPSLPSSNLNHSTPNRNDLLQLAETIAHATSLIQAAGLSPGKMSVNLILSNRQFLEILQNRNSLSDSSKRGDLLSNIKLPEPKQLASINATVEARCFIVCSPQPLSPSTLRDIFCRFGNLIDVYLLFNRNCGYAKYATKESAENAIMVLNGAEISGVRIKVVEAEERDHNRKRLRLDDTSIN